MDTRKRVLVVDDEPGIVKVVGIKLRLHGYDVMTATSGVEAVKLAREWHPDILILDILMPGMSGVEVLEKVRVFSRAPVIVFSASPDIARFAAGMGAADFVAKPFDPDHMVEKIRKVLSRNGKNETGVTPTSPTGE